MPQTFKLSFGTSAIVIKQFTTYRQQIVGGGPPTYSLSGTSIDGGYSYEAKRLWEIGTIMEESEMLMLHGIFAQTDLNRRNLTAYDLSIEDSITPFVEPGTANTRALVPTTVTTPIGTVAISYYAQYKGGFIAPPKIEPYSTLVWQVDFSIAEFDKVPAP